MLQIILLLILVSLAIIMIFFMIKADQVINKSLEKINDINIEMKKKDSLFDAIADFRKSNARSLKYHIDVFFNRILPDALYPGNYFYSLREAIRENLTGWHRSLIWCPSQVTKVLTYKGYDVTLYLRWRHEDPWTAKFIIENDHVTIWSEELIENKNFTEETPIRILELEMEKLYKKYFIDKTENLKLSHRRFKNGWASNS